jgi:hypothetical protein
MISLVLLLFVRTAFTQSAGRAYWNTATTLTPYRLIPPPPGFKPEYLDLNGDGKPDAIRSITANDVPVLWLDDDGDMQPNDLEGDTDSDCLLIDRNRDGKFGSWGDLIIDWVDTDSDGKADMQVVIEYPDSIPEGPFGPGHYMWVLDTDGDNVFNYIDWNTLRLHNWDRVELSNFYTDYSGNSAFLKIHTYTNAMDDLSLNWENPFLFYDPDGDGLSEMAIRLCDSPRKVPGKVEGKDANVIKLSGKIDWVSIAVDMDNDTRPGNDFDFDMTVNFRGPGFDYTDQVHPLKNLRGLPEADRFFMDPRYRQLDHLTYPAHDVAQQLTFERGKWDRVYFVYDEDDDCKRWERVELYDPMKLFVTGSNKGGLDNNTQSDIIGDRGEWDLDASGSGKLYISPADGRIHLLGAEWGAWRIDKNASVYQGYNRSFMSREPKKFATVKYSDRDNNGFLDCIEYDLDGDTIFEETVNLKELGIEDRAQAIDISKYTYADFVRLKQQVSDNMWANALLAEKIAKKYGINTSWYAKLHDPASTFEKYSNGYWLQFYLYKDLQDLFIRRNDSALLRKLTQAYYSSSWDLL